jgi:hypothetical protein
LAASRLWRDRSEHSQDRSEEGQKTEEEANQDPVQGSLYFRDVAFNAVEPLVDLVKARLRLFSSLGDPAIHFDEALVDPLELAVDLDEALVHPLELAIDVVEAFVHTLELLVVGLHRLFPLLGNHRQVASLANHM